MIEAYKKFFINYAKFDGCSSRSDYWWVMLCHFLVGFVIGFISGLTGVEELSYLSYIYELAIIVPSIAIVVRRLHDINKSGWYYFMVLIPIAGPIIFLIYMLTDRVEPNNFGERI